MNEQIHENLKTRGFERFNDLSATAPYHDYDRYTVVNPDTGAELKEQVTYNEDENYWYGTLLFSPSKDESFDEIYEGESRSQKSFEDVIKILEREVATYLTKNA